MHDAIYALPRVGLSALETLDEELGVAGTPAIFVSGRKMSGFRAQTVGMIVEHVASETDGP